MCMSLVLIDKELQKVVLILVATAPDSNVPSPTSGTVAVSAGVSYTAFELPALSNLKSCLKLPRRLTEPGLNAYFTLPLFAALVYRWLILRATQS